MASRIRRFALVTGTLLVVIAIVWTAGRKAGKSAAEKTCAAYRYPGKQKLDHCAAPGGNVESAGVLVAAGGLNDVGGTADRAELCADVAYVNRTNTTKRVNSSDWKLLTPNGTAESAQLAEEMLQSGELGAGESTSGRVCFADTGEHGQFVLLWTAASSGTDRGVWLNAL